MLHVIDDMDAHLNAMINVEEEVNPGEVSAQFIKAIDARVYKPTFRKDPE